MREGSWEECIENNSALKISPDKERAHSLLQTAKARKDFLNIIELDDANARFIFEGYYSSALEIMHALVLKEGIKIDNHICLGYYLRDVLKKEDLYRIFNDSRYKRNSIVYYGEEMELNIAKESVKKIKVLIKEIEKILE